MDNITISEPGIQGQIGELYNPDVIDLSAYYKNPSACFSLTAPSFTPLVVNPSNMLRTIKKHLQVSPAFIEAVKSRVPTEIWQAMLTDEQQEKLASGALELMTKKDGTILAKLVHPKTKRMVSNIAIEKVTVTPQCSQALSAFSSQMMVAQIAEEIQGIRTAIEDVRKGLEDDRLAAAYSCLQKYYQAISIRNKRLRETALLQIVMDAEDSRNRLMLRQKSHVEAIATQPESFFKKLVNGASKDDIDGHVNTIRDCLNATNLVTIAMAMAYQSLGEQTAAERSLAYYASFLQQLYFNTNGLIDRLDMVDPSPVNYWSVNLPKLVEHIQCLPSYTMLSLEEAI